MTTKPRQAAAQQPLLSRSKRMLFTATTLLFPFLVLGLIEISLRGLHWGPDLSLFKEETIGGRTYCVFNPDMKGRYFATIEFTPNTSPDYFQVPKSKDTYRIFCLGGSTTIGFPYGPGGSFAAFLRDRLRHLFPEKKIEIINLGMTATNSFTVLDIAKELADYEPDLFVVYDGHNEFYGALGIASNESIGKSRWLIQSYLRIVHFRTFLLARDLFHQIRSMTGEPERRDRGTMMERLAAGQLVHYGSPTYTLALETYRQNLADLKSWCASHRIPVLYGSQASNLRDQPPFVSEDADSGKTRKAVAAREAIRIGTELFTAGRFDSALVQFQSGAMIDPLRADLHYNIARCMDTLQRKDHARREYVLARDLDMLRFRASSDFNNAIAEASDGRNFIFVDIERKLRSNSPDSLVGNTLMLEHLHPNLRGQFLMAKEFAQTMHFTGKLVDIDTWNMRNNPDDDLLWREKTVTQIDERAAKRRTEILTSSWPFEKTKQVPPAHDPNDALSRIAGRLVIGELTWEQAHVEAAQYSEAKGDLDEAAHEYRTLTRQLPQNVSPYLFLGRTLLTQGKNLDAASVLVQSLEVEKTPYAYKALGLLAVQPDTAAMFFARALSLGENPAERAEAGFLLSDAYLRGGRKEEALRQLQEVIQNKPDFAPAQALLRRIQQSPQ